MPQAPPTYLLWIRDQTPQQGSFAISAPPLTLWIETFCLWDNKGHLRSRTPGFLLLQGLSWGLSRHHCSEAGADSGQCNGRSRRLGKGKKVEPLRAR